MGYSATSPQLSDRKLYPNFYRTGGSDMAMVAPIIALIKMFDWKIVATIHQTDPLFATVSLQCVYFIAIETNFWEKYIIVCNLSFMSILLDN